MSSEHPRSPTGLQVAFLIFAVVLLATPFQKYVAPMMGLGLSGTYWDRLYIFVPAIAILALVPALRRYCLSRLRQPIAPGQRTEVAIVAGAHVLLPFALAAAVMLWYWVPGGEMALARRIGNQMSPEAEFARALTLQGAAGHLLLAGLVAPVVEELVFRGLLYDAWKEQWGWFWSMLATSAVFAAYHPIPFGAFVSSIIFIAVMRRTGSLRASIIAHGAGNIALWYPLMGQLYFSMKGKETGEIHLWWMHLAALGLLAIVVPVYAWMSRDAATLDDPMEADTVAAR
jgi:membrane protease YdiL (CAAX protease family)